MTVGTLVRVKTKIWREGEIGVIVKQWPPSPTQDDNGLRRLVDTYSVLFWDEKIDRIAAICLEEL